MKPLEERQQYIDYMGGKQIPAHAFTNGALDIFGDYVWEDVKKDECTRQSSLPIEGFEGDIFYQKVHPIEPEKTPEQQHLSRPTELKNGITYVIGESFDRAYEQMRISEVRRQLRNVKI